MEEKHTIKISLSTFFLILSLLAIIIMGIFIYKLNKDKSMEIQKSSQLQEQVDNLNGTISDLQGKISSISETIKDTNSTQQKEYDDIVLDGHYVIPNSDISWDFTKDGKVASGGNMSVIRGTYETTGKNIVQLHYTKKKIWDDITSEVTINNIDTYENAYIDENNTVYIIDKNGEQTKLERFGDVVRENFE